MSRQIETANRINPSERVAVELSPIDRILFFLMRSVDPDNAGILSSNIKFVTRGQINDFCAKCDFFRDCPFGLKGQAKRTAITLCFDVESNGQTGFISQGEFYPMPRILISLISRPPIVP